jgi:hemerythrin superfamily protein
MKCTTLLERQHRNLQQLCEAVERGSPSIRESLLPQLAGDLVAHIAVEEQLFYPRVCAALHDETWMRETYVRHAQTRCSLERILGTPVDGAEFENAIGELRTLVELHAEEEEKSVFPQVEQALEGIATRELAHAMMKLYLARVEAGYPGEWFAGDAAQRPNAN